MYNLIDNGIEYHVVSEGRGYCTVIMVSYQDTVDHGEFWIRLLWNEKMHTGVVGIYEIETGFSGKNDRWMRQELKKKAEGGEKGILNDRYKILTVHMTGAKLKSRAVEITSQQQDSSELKWRLSRIEKPVFNRVWAEQLKKMITRTDKRQYKSALIGKEFSGFAFAIIGDKKSFPAGCYIVTRTRGQGGYGKFRYGMAMRGPATLVGVKVFRTIEKIGPVYRSYGLEKGKLTDKSKTSISKRGDIAQEIKNMKNARSGLRIKQKIEGGGSGKIYGVMQSMEGDISQVIGMPGESKGSKKLIGRYLVYKIAKDLVNCNKAELIHNDVKPDNIFYNEKGVFLGDFGACREIKIVKAGGADAISGTPTYWPMEYFCRGAPGVSNESIDIYGLGMTWAEFVMPQIRGRWKESAAWPTEKNCEAVTYIGDIHPIFLRGGDCSAYYDYARFASALFNYLLPWQNDSIIPGGMFKRGFVNLKKIDPDMFNLLIFGMLTPHYGSRLTPTDVAEEMEVMMAGRIEKAKRCFRNMVLKSEKHKKLIRVQSALKAGRKYILANGGWDAL